MQPFHFFYRKLYTRLGGPDVLEFYNSVPKANFNFAYVNNTRNYIINRVQDLLGDTQCATMFANKEVFVIHRADQDCSQPSESGEETSSNTAVSDFIIVNYPKQRFLKIVATILEKNNLVNSDLFFESFPQIHVADFIAFINNRFDKKENVSLTKLCKFMQTKRIKFPQICIKNGRAKKYLC